MAKRKSGKRRSGYSRPGAVDPSNFAHIRIAIRIPAELKARFDAYCQDTGFTMSELVRMDIEERVARGQPSYGEKRAAE